MSNYCDGIDPTAASDWDRPAERLKCEFKAAKMAPDELTSSQKWSLAIAGGFWMALTVYWAVYPADIPQFLIYMYLAYTGLLCYIVGRIHKVPMDKIRKLAENGVNLSLGDENE